MSVWIIESTGVLPAQVLHRPDATLAETETLSSTITNIPVESRDSVADNIVKGPRLLTLQEVVSDVTPPAPGDLPSISRRSLGAWDSIRALWDDRALFDVLTERGVILNVAITSLSPTVSYETERALMYSASLQTVSFSEIELSSIMAISAADLASGSEDLGLQESPV